MTVVEAEKQVSSFKKMVENAPELFEDESTLEIVVRLLKEDNWQSVEFDGVDFSDYSNEEDEFIL